MSHVLSLISNPADQALDQACMEEVADCVRGAGHAISDPLWLARGIACEWTLQTPLAPGASGMPGTFVQDVRTLLEGRPVDVNLLPARHRRKKLLLADMDSTIIEQECLDEIAAFAGVKEKVAGITARAMAGELDFASALRERVALLRGLDTAVLDKVIQKHITLAPGARTLVETMRQAGAVTALVSGGFTYFTSRIAQACGFEFNFGNELDIRDGKLTGAVKEPVLGKQEKHANLLRLTARSNLLPDQTMAVGDGANDKDMITAAGLGVAIHAKPVLRNAADAVIDHGDLTALLYLQGYAQTDFSHN